MRIMLVDDDLAQCEKLSNILTSTCGLSEDGILIFTHPEDALEHFDQNHIDVAILDIIMPDMHGTQLAIELRQAGFKGYIIFLTSSNDFASESYAANAFAYILKPVEEKKLVQTIDNIRRDMDLLDNAAILLPLREVKRRIFLCELIYVEVTGHTLNFHLAGGEILSRSGTLKSYAPELLADERFSSPHSAFIVNMDFIRRIERNNIVLTSGQNIPIAKRYMAFKQTYAMRFIRNGGMK